MKQSVYRYILIFLLFPALASRAQKQELKFTTVSGSNGISLGKINSIVRDRYGFLWLSDQSNRCIIRYDGSHMTRYQNDPKNPNSLGGFYPECLFADSSGNIWVGFYGMGLDKFDPVSNRFTHYRHTDNKPGSLANDFVTAILDSTTWEISGWVIIVAWICWMRKQGNSNILKKIQTIR